MTDQLTAEQRRIVEFGDGPLVVIAGAGTGKTRVIIERVRYLLEHRADLLPEQLLVLTYNVKAARELQERLDEAVGRATRARITVTNFHSFCQRILTDSAADAGLPARPDVLDGVGQVLLLRDIGPDLPLVYHSRSNWALGNFVKFINRAKDELVTPDDFDAFVEGRTSGVRGPVRELRGRRRAPRGPGQPRPPAAGPRRLRRRPGQRAGGSPGRGPHVQGRRGREDRRSRGPPHDRRHRPRGRPQPVRPR